MKDPAFPFYAQDFIVGTMHMTFEEMGAFIKLLAYQWVNLGIPKNRLGFILGSGWETVWASISDKFIEEDGILYNKRIEEERDKRKAFKLKQAENGKKGGRPKKNQPSDYKPNKTSKTIGKNPTKTQKNPLENESEYENKSVIDNRKEGKGEKQKIVYPFDTKTFSEQWAIWKDYKANEHGFKYKTAVSEQAALSSLGTLSKYDEATAIAIMHQSMANGWKGFFEENTTHGSTKQPSGKGESSYSDAFKRKIVGRLQSE
ncbi:hypothetical protein [Flavobacterium suzhouense]|uniref:DUF1376 domain-containing protein n=1 Tax=Flavobacterium suzhouense TaxID=1529638 RepID=A0ABW5NSH0_9FLAO